MRSIWIVLLKEMRDQLRDRRTVLMVFIPIVMVPIACLLVSLQLTGSSRNDTPIYFDAGSYGANATAARMVQGALLDLQVQFVDSSRPYSDLQEGKVKALVRLGVSGRTEIVQNESSLDSVGTAVDLEKQLQQLRLAQNYRSPLKEGGSLDGAVLEVDVTRLSSYMPGAANAVLVLVAPTMLVMLILIESGSFAADLFAGEKERGTIEALLSTQVSRRGLLVGKYLAIVVLGSGATLLTIGGYVMSYLLFPAAMELLGLPGSLALTVEMGVCVALLCGSFTLAASALGVLMSISSKSMKEAQARWSAVSAFPIFLGIATAALSGDWITAVSRWLPIVNTLVGLKSAFGLAETPLDIAIPCLMNACLVFIFMYVTFVKLEGEDWLGR